MGSESLGRQEESNEFKHYYEELEEKEDLEDIEESQQEFNKLSQSLKSNEQINQEDLSNRFFNLEENRLNISKKQNAKECEDLRDWMDTHQDDNLIIPKTSFEEVQREHGDFGKDKFRQRITQKDVQKLHEARINNFTYLEDKQRQIPSQIHDREEPGIFDENKLKNDQEEDFEREIEEEVKYSGFKDNEDEQMNIRKKNKPIRDFTFKKKNENENINNEQIEHNKPENMDKQENILLLQQVDPEDEEEFDEIKHKIEGKGHEGDTTGKFGKEENKEFKGNNKNKEEKMASKAMKKRKKRLRQYLSGERSGNSEDQKEQNFHNKSSKKEISKQNLATYVDSANKSFKQLQFDSKMGNIHGSNPKAQIDYKLRHGSLQAFSDFKGNTKERGNDTMQGDR